MDCKTALTMIDLYIKKQLSKSELEAFLDHIKICRECKEELEIYFTVSLALQKLDEEGDVSFNIQKLLQDNLAASARKIQRIKLMRIFNYALILMAEAVLVVVILTQIQAANIGGYNDTYMYRIMHKREAELETELKRESRETEKNDGKENSTDRRA